MLAICSKTILENITKKHIQTFTNILAILRPERLFILALNKLKLSSKNVITKYIKAGI